MNEENICQSCGMPMQNDEMHGTNEDGSKDEEYCVYCFKEGKFTMDVSLEEYIEKLVGMAKSQGVEEDKARAHAKSVLPTLKRWQK